MVVSPLHRSRSSLVLALLAAAGLAYDAYVHLDLAHVYDGNGSSITQGGLFRAEAVIAILVGVAVLASDHWMVWAAAGLTGLGGAALVVLYRYVDVGAIGPVPNMHEPVWYAEKSRSAIAEAGVGVVWIAREALRYLGMRATSHTHERTGG